MLRTKMKVENEKDFQEPGWPRIGVDISSALMQVLEELLGYRAIEPQEVVYEDTD